MHDVKKWLAKSLCAGVLLGGVGLTACAPPVVRPGGPGDEVSGGPGAPDTPEQPRPAVPPPPKSYCDSLQPYLTRAGTQGGLNVKFTCFDLPGITSSAFYGTRDVPTTSQLESCFPDSQKAQAIVREQNPFDFGYEHTWSRNFDASGGLDLSSLGKWGPVLTADGAKGESASVTVKFENVRIRVITDLRKRLTHCEDQQAATTCINDLSSDKTIFSPMTLVGRMVVSVKAGANTSIGGDLDVAKTLKFKIRSIDSNSGAVTLESEGDVTIAGVIQQSNEVVPPDTSCLMRAYIDNDGDGFGAANSPMVMLASLKGHSLNSADCDDSNKNVFPGQEGFFAESRTNGSWDYNCDGSTTKRWEQKGQCKRNGLFGECHADHGYDGDPPACGETKQWLEDCDCPVRGGLVKEGPQRKQECH